MQNIKLKACFDPSAFALHLSACPTQSFILIQSLLEIKTIKIINRKGRGGWNQLLCLITRSLQHILHLELLHMGKQVPVRLSLNNFLAPKCKSHYLCQCRFRVQYKKPPLPQNSWMCEDLLFLFGSSMIAVQGIITTSF